MEKYFNGKAPFFFGGKWFFYNKAEKKWEIQEWCKLVKNKTNRMNNYLILMLTAALFLTLFFVNKF
jgi:hypothetical protein